MREILFRGKRKADNTWISGLFVNNNYGAWIVNYCDIVGRFEYQEVIPETVGQFTGLNDKNDKKVFEGDYDVNYDVVAWCDKRQGWAMKAYDSPTDDFMLCHCYQCEGNFEINDIDMSLEIIGNIHNNPELIKQGGAK